MTDSYSAWLELEIGVNAHSVALPWKERKRLFAQRIKAGLAALEQAAPGIRARLEGFPGRPFAFTGKLTADQIRGIWHLPELRMLHDRDEEHQPAADELGRLPYLVDVLEHIQAEDSAVVEVERVTVIVRAKDENEAIHTAVAECGTMPAHFVGSNYRIHRRWWTAEQASINTIYDEQLPRYGDAIVVDRTAERKLREQPTWQPDTRVERVVYGSPKQRPKTWEWMLR